MASQSSERGAFSVPPLGDSPRTESLTSKFLRKAKFRQSLLSGPSEPNQSPDLGGPTSISNSKEGLNSSNEQTVSDNNSIPPTASTPQPSGHHVASLADSTVSTEDVQEKQSLPENGTTAGSTSSQPNTIPPSSPVNSIASSRPSSPKAASCPQAVEPASAASGPEFSSFPLSQDELDQAKSIVLDLLGWGVDPEYLVTTGLSPLVIFRVFTDLNLRLPTNLEMPEDSKTLAYPYGQHITDDLIGSAVST